MFFPSCADSRLLVTAEGDLGECMLGPQAPAEPRYVRLRIGHVYGKVLGYGQVSLCGRIRVYLVRNAFHHRCLERITEDLHPAGLYFGNRPASYRPQTPKVFRLIFKCKPSNGLYGNLNFFVDSMMPLFVDDTKRVRCNLVGRDSCAITFGITSVQYLRPCLPVS